MTLLLHGYRGSGKTTLGKHIAKRLGLPFFDTDALVRERFGGLEVADIWARHGEPAFRAVEVDVMRELLGFAPLSATPSGHGRLKPTLPCVIALGGGTLMQPGALAAVRQAPNSLRVYLRAPAEVLAKRIGGDAVSAGQRPSLTGTGSATDEVAQMLSRREPTYLAAADKVLDASALSLETLDPAADQIIAWMKEHS